MGGWTSTYGALLFSLLTVVFVLHRVRQTDVTKSIQKLGINHSNLKDEYVPAHNTKKHAKVHVKSIWIYPVKSCRGIELEMCRIVKTGLEFDRMFTFAMLKEAPQTKQVSWDIITQRQYPLLSQVVTDLDVESTSPSGGTVHVSFPSRVKWRRFARITHNFTLPLLGTKDILERYQTFPVHIWKEHPKALDMSEHARHLFPQLKAFLGIDQDKKIGLFRMPPDKPRKVYRNAPTADALGYQPLVAFADSYPIHLMNLSSVQDLNLRIKADIPELSIKRFRANIIISGVEAYEEDNWKRFAVGKYNYLAVTRCVRCRLPNTDQQSGHKHPSEPDRTMRKYRNIDDGSPMNACMGMQVVPEAELGWVHVGDVVKVLETGKHRYIAL